MKKTTKTKEAWKESRDAMVRMLKNCKSEDEFIKFLKIIMMMLE